MRCRKQPGASDERCMVFLDMVIYSVPTKRGGKSRRTVNTPNQPSIRAYFKTRVDPATTVRYKVRREETAGVNVGHLRRLARLGGTIPLGELAFNTLLCTVCQKGENEDSLIICDKCNKGYHLYCLKPSLPSVPSGEWFCSSCQENRKKSYYKNLARYQQSQSLIVDFFKLTRPIAMPARYNFRSSTKPSIINYILLIRRNGIVDDFEAFPSTKRKG